MNYQVISLKQQTSIISQFLQVWNLGEDLTGRLAQDLSGGCSRDVGQSSEGSTGSGGSTFKIIHSWLVSGGLNSLFMMASALHPIGPSGRAVLVFSRASNPRESKEEAVLLFYCLLSEVAFHHFAVSCWSHRPGTLHVCAGGTVQGHEYWQRRSRGQPGCWLPQTLLVTASKNIKHLWINLTKYMLNLHTENDKIQKKLRPKWRKYIQRLQIVGYRYNIIKMFNIFQCIGIQCNLGGFFNRNWWTVNKICM